jgi:mRNA interferase MazF
MWLDLDPIRGHEQSGRRPALVLSSKAYNAKSGLAAACPITSQAKGYPFEVAFKTQAIQGVILSDQIRSIDWNERRAEKACALSATALSEVQDFIQKLVAD